MGAAHIVCKTSRVNEDCEKSCIGIWIASLFSRFSSTRYANERRLFVNVTGVFEVYTATPCGAKLRDEECREAPMISKTLSVGKQSKKVSRSLIKKRFTTNCAIPFDTVVNRDFATCTKYFHAYSVPNSLTRQWQCWSEAKLGIVISPALGKVHDSYVHYYMLWLMSIFCGMYSWECEKFFSELARPFPSSRPSFFYLRVLLLRVIFNPDLGRNFIGLEARPHFPY
ncbi:hypothetical protein CEXT_147541 [Caerostris extrusa]|uniref:Uncharacterized protein n=1 Tax=Caerostris extrusa TaxID=172846 RepID=A0AAV4T042_CAEEX|nr:hypothetical protein CEXT_147541 [Caerostris extrusa]